MSINSSKELNDSFVIGKFESIVYRTNTSVNSINFNFDTRYKNKDDLDSNNLPVGFLVVTILLPDGKNLKSEKQIVVTNNINQQLSFTYNDFINCKEKEFCKCTHFKYVFVLARKKDAKASIDVLNIKIDCKGSSNKDTYKASQAFYQGIISPTNTNGIEVSKIKEITYDGDEDLYNNIIIRSRVYKGDNNYVNGGSQLGDEIKRIYNERWSNPHRLMDNKRFKRIKCKDGVTEGKVTLTIDPKDFISNKEMNKNAIVNARSNRLFVDVSVPNILGYKNSGTQNTEGKNYNDLYSLHEISKTYLSSGWFKSKEIDVLYEHTDLTKETTKPEDSPFISVVIKKHEEGKDIDDEINITEKTYCFLSSGIYEIPINNTNNSLDIQFEIVKGNNLYPSPCINNILFDTKNDYKEIRHIEKNNEYSCEVNQFLEMKGTKPKFTKRDENGTIINTQWFDLCNLDFSLPYWFDFNNLNCIKLNSFSLNLDQDMLNIYKGLKVQIAYSTSLGDLIYKGEAVPAFGYLNNVAESKLLLKGEEASTDLMNKIEERVVARSMGAIIPFISVEYDFKNIYFSVPVQTSELFDNLFIDEDNEELIGDNEGLSDDILSLVNINNSKKYLNFNNLKNEFYIQNPYDDNLKEYTWKLSFVEDPDNIVFDCFYTNLDNQDESADSIKINSMISDKEQYELFGGFSDIKGTITAESYTDDTNNNRLIIDQDEDAKVIEVVEAGRLDIGESGFENIKFKENNSLLMIENGADLFGDVVKIANEMYLDDLSTPLYLVIYSYESLDLILKKTINKLKFTGTINNGYAKEDYFRVFDINDLFPGISSYKNLKVYSNNDKIPMSYELNGSNLIIQTNDADVSSKNFVPGIEYSYLGTYTLENQNSSKYYDIEILYDSLPEYVDKNTKFVAKSKDESIDIQFTPKEKSVIISSNKKKDILKTWGIKMKKGYYNLGLDQYKYDPEASIRISSDFNKPVTENIISVKGVDGNMGELRKSCMVVKSNLIEIEDEYYCIEEN